MLTVRFSSVVFSSNRLSSLSCSPSSTKRSLFTLKKIRLSLSRSKQCEKIWRICAYGRSAKRAPRKQINFPRFSDVRIESVLIYLLARDVIIMKKILTNLENSID